MIDISIHEVERGGFVLRDISLTVNDGEVCLVYGENGSGKTTFLDALSGFAQSSGHVYVDGTNIAGWSCVKRHREVLARTFQQPPSHRALLLANRLVERSTGQTQQGESRVFRLIEENGQSFGQRKLRSVSYALRRDMSVCLIDEPTTGLTGQNSVRAAKMVSAACDFGATIIAVVHHPPQELVDLCTITARVENNTVQVT